MFPEIVQHLKDPFDYSEYEKVEINPMTMATYAQKLGMLMVARKSFPGLPDGESLQKLKDRMNENYLKQAKNPLPQPYPSGCSGCGGKAEK